MSRPNERWLGPNAAAMVSLALTSVAVSKLANAPRWNFARLPKPLCLHGRGQGAPRLASLLHSPYHAVLSNFETHFPVDGTCPKEVEERGLQWYGDLLDPADGLLFL